MLSGVPYTVVGVAPAGFSGVLPGLQPEFWVPVTMVDRLSFSGVQAVTDNDPGATELQRRGNRWLFLKGRLAPGRSVAEAQAEAEVVFARLRKEFPVTNDKTRVTVLPASSIRFHPLLDGYVKTASAVLLAAVGWCWSSRAPTSPACCSLEAPRARASSRVRAAHRREQRSALVAAADGEPGARDRGRSARRARRHVGDDASLARIPKDALPVPVQFDLRVDGDRARLRRARVPGQHAPLRPAACLESLAARARPVAESRRRR